MKRNTILNTNDRVLYTVYLVAAKRIASDFTPGKIDGNNSTVKGDTYKSIRSKMYGELYLKKAGRAWYFEVIYKIFKTKIHIWILLCDITGECLGTAL